MTSTKNKMAPSNEDTSEHLSQQVENLSIADDMLTTPHVPIVAKRVVALIFATNVNQRRIVMQPVKRSIVISIKRNVKGVWLSYTRKNWSVNDEQRSCMTKSYLNGLHRMMTVQYVCCQ